MDSGMSITTFKSFWSNLLLTSSRTTSKASKYFCRYISEVWMDGVKVFHHRFAEEAYIVFEGLALQWDSETQRLELYRSLQNYYLFAAFAKKFSMTSAASLASWTVVSLDWRVWESCSVGAKITMYNFSPKNVQKSWSFLINPPAFIAYSSRPVVIISSKVESSVSYNCQELLW